MISWAVLIAAMIPMAPPPAVVAPVDPVVKPGAHNYYVRKAERLLYAQGYLREQPDKTWNLQTTNAVYAFQGYHGLSRDAVIGPRTWQKLKTAKKPTPYKAASGKQIQVSIKRQTVLLIENGKVRYLLHTSSGQSGYTTPTGSWTISRRLIYDESLQYDNAPMPYAQYFYRGYAFHESSSVPGYPASHGCFRLSHADASFLWSWSKLGTPVHVVA